MSLSSPPRKCDGDVKVLHPCAALVLVNLLDLLGWGIINKFKLVVLVFSVTALARRVDISLGFRVKVDTSLVDLSVSLSVNLSIGLSVDLSVGLVVFLRQT